MSLLADLAAVRGTDLSSLDDAGLAGLGRLIGRGRRDLAAFATAVAVEAKRRESSGSSPCADDLSDPDGEGSASARAKDSARGEIRLDLPASGAGSESGAAKTENADHLAGCLARLSASEKARLAGHDGEIASNAALLRPEAFRTWLARLLVKVADPPDGDEGLSAAERAMAAASWMMFRRPDGTWAVAASMDDERGARMDAAVTARAREIADLRPSGQRTVTANDRARAAFELLCGVTLDGSGVMGGSAGPGAAGSCRTSGDWCGGGSDGSSCDGGPGVAPDGAAGAAAGPAERGSGTDGVDDRVMGPNLAVGLIVDAATLVHGPHAGSVTETWGGRPVDPAAALRRCCDADWYVMVYDALGRPTRVGRSRRYATREQRLQLRGLYRTCPIDGVTPFHRCEIHHVNLDYELGGETELHNLVPISTEWHHRIHDGGWSLTMDADRTLRLFRPDGTLDRVIDPPTPITRHGP
ncbi:MAG: hypothetical protein ACE367_15705 [Acidimicrobiales bacterium]